MTLKTVTKTIHEVSWSDLEQFVAEKTGVNDYSFVAVEECNNDSIHEFNVSADNDSFFGPEDMDEWIASNGNTFISNNEILDWLCINGHIEPGIYLVSVCW